MKTNAEQQRLQEARNPNIPWKKWGPYLSERQWGTVREDYSDDGNAWSYFSHDQARSRAYHWSEDGRAGISDNKDGHRPVNGGEKKLQEDPHWRDCIHFYEYFHGDNGASHQTGWTGGVARAMHLFTTSTAEQLLELGKRAAHIDIVQQDERTEAAAPLV